MLYVIRFGWLAIIAPFVLAAQQGAPAPAPPSRTAGLLAGARALMQQTNGDSALTLLAAVVDSKSGALPGERVEAYVLIGVVRLLGHGDSAGTAQAFRHALQLEPGLQAEGLAETDPRLERIMAAERQRLSPAAVADSGEVHSCVRRCRHGETMPRLLGYDAPPLFEGGGGLGPGGTKGMHATVTLQLIVGSGGAPEPESFQITSVVGPGQDFVSQIERMMQTARFRPAYDAQGAPVRAMIHLRFDFRAQGMTSIEWEILGP